MKLDSGWYAGFCGRDEVVDDAEASCLGRAGLTSKQGIYGFLSPFES
jgi:hypothetical protein